MLKKYLRIMGLIKWLETGGINVVKVGKRRRIKDEGVTSSKLNKVIALSK